MGILTTKQQSGISDDFFNVIPAGEFEPLPAGEYPCVVDNNGSGVHISKKGTQGYKLKFRVISGEYDGRIIWHDLWLTPAARPYSVRDLGKLGIANAADLHRPLRKGIKCRVKVVIRQSDNGDERNEVKTFNVTGIHTEVDPFTPAKDVVVTTTPVNTTPITVTATSVGIDPNTLEMPEAEFMEQLDTSLTLPKPDESCALEGEEFLQHLKTVGGCK